MIPRVRKHINIPACIFFKSRTNVPNQKHFSGSKHCPNNGDRALKSTKSNKIQTGLGSTQMNIMQEFKLYVAHIYKYFFMHACASVHKTTKIDSFFHKAINIEICIKEIDSTGFSVKNQLQPSCSNKTSPTHIIQTYI